MVDVSSKSDSAFLSQLPLALQTNYEGKNRRYGIEIEFGEIDLDTTADIAAKHLGGNLERENEYCFSINTELGQFRVENDVGWLQKIAQNRKDGVAPGAMEDLAERFAGPIARGIMPIELVAPPLEVADLANLNAVAETLRNAGAKGTWGSPLHAFGVHLNAEAWSLRSVDIAATVSAFAIVQRLLLDVLVVDLSRRVTPFIDPYPEKYVELTVAETSYSPSQEQLIADYLAHNPTRNRALDLTCLLRHLDDERITSAIPEEAHLINARPAFHYRLPNSQIGQKDWNVTDALRSWTLVELLASDGAILAQARKDMRDKQAGQLLLPAKPNLDWEWVRDLLTRVGLTSKEATGALRKPKKA